ncbi:right-handed parallel beta-helix repeat-containing protein [Nitrosovibrio tenuis]|uniref:Right handed beta helix region n=1 Tax=Nitrosovibrio tenuis TaxID=1233 RepID=A0A1H7G338_9PROT|nr:right-handed parallel beta-helix repeat-containing protein [Nitrosovibrio tenuis]SEK30870.1 Right handed beta helix region [Nitrosovibrio tenuis]
MGKLRLAFIRFIMTLAGTLSGALPALANTIHTGNPHNYLAKIKMLGPGSHLRLKPGEYKGGLPIQYLQGTAQAPITISGPDSGPRPVFVARPRHNTISIVNSSYITLRNLDLDGRDLPVDGVKCEGHADWAHHINLDGLRVFRHGNNQQTVGISTKCPAWGWVIRRNVIAGAGTGLYLGDSDGRAPFVGGLIEHNLIVDTQGYNLQIKHQQTRPMVPDMPRTPDATTIRHNVFSKAGGGSTKEMARPNVLVGHWPLSGPGSDDLYLVYGNFFYQNPDESLFQGEGNIALYNNLLINNFGDAVRIQPHNDTTREVSVFYNTVIAAGAGIRLKRREGDPPYPQLIAGNAIFSPVPLAGHTGENNLIGGYEAAREYLAKPFSPLGEMDLTPLPGKVKSLLIDIIRLRIYPESENDFDGSLHGACRIGAYALNKSSPRWMPALQIKPAPAMQ